ncbi:flagellar assembly peptidoglycan hydrolase FlgJ [Comamonas sp. Y33R10-2]|uniref:flagellar assembly peptidoglycan hydrolase FlgJ n=1 Tax=Comamonas sp. Y33R10-2 TaxID=2853257 RepID=UPI001C5CAFA9|nr:flagellar assembly peptidoglycan hydrolase FlgJ [Comamonas sp. Y33R10-2]QXZ09020.1 flagellar assembly peptidoglycan hydrolase FlgJ [Comamonas sp. Y33R10-2]
MSMSLSQSSTLVTNNALAVDTKSLSALKTAAGENSPQAIRETAKQLESLFMREMIKSMREATMKSGLLDSAQGNLSTDLLDQQLSVAMAGQPGGLTDAINKQLARTMGVEAADDAEIAVPSTLSMSRSAWRNVGSHGAWSGSPAQAAQSVNAYAPAPKGRDNFVAAHTSAAQRIASESGIPAHYMVGQAGHETGWGKSEIRNKDGSNSFNLFGIKAGGSWKGKVAEVTTTEYINGAPKKITAKFRAYDSFEESFRDYARLIGSNPRYEKAMAKTGSAQDYASELQKAGYATDPAYAQKLSRAIQSVQQLQVAAGNSNANSAGQLASRSTGGASSASGISAHRAAQINKNNENQS